MVSDRPSKKFSSGNTHEQESVFTRTGHERLTYMSNKILAIVLLVVGLILLYFAYNSSQSLGDQVSEAVTGRFTDSTIWFLILGAASTVAGGGLLIFGKSANN